MPINYLYFNLPRMPEFGIYLDLFSKLELLEIKSYIDRLFQKVYKPILTFRCPGRGGRAAEGPALEKQYPAKSGIVGSNPTLSATYIKASEKKM